MRRRSPAGFAARLSAAICATALMACASPEPLFVDLPAEDATTEETAPLGGDALAERRREMQRAYRDLIHFHATQESLRHRRDKRQKPGATAAAKSSRRTSRAYQPIQL